MKVNLTLEQAEANLEKEYNEAFLKYGYVEYDFTVGSRFEKVTRAQSDVYTCLVMEMVEEGMVTPPNVNELTRCVFDMFFFAVHGYIANDASTHGREVINILNSSEPSTSVIH